MFLVLGGFESRHTIIKTVPSSIDIRVNVDEQSLGSSDWLSFSQNRDRISKLIGNGSLVFRSFSLSFSSFLRILLSLAMFTRKLSTKMSDGFAPPKYLLHELDRSGSERLRVCLFKLFLI